jgi:hypothetical protein
MKTKSWDRLRAQCRSEAETLMLEGFLDPDVGKDVEVGEYDGHPALVLRYEGECLFLVPRCPVRIAGLSYELDFALFNNASHPGGASGIALDIEIDGHQWHERSKEQAARDRQRDRAVLGGGYAPVRFTGAEVWASGADCARQALDVAVALRRRETNISEHSWHRACEHMGAYDEDAEEATAP